MHQQFEMLHQALHQREENLKKLYSNQIQSIESYLQRDLQVLTDKYRSTIKTFKKFKLLTDQFGKNSFTARTFYRCRNRRQLGLRLRALRSSWARIAGD